MRRGAGEHKQLSDAGARRGRRTVSRLAAVLVCVALSAPAQAEGLTSSDHLVRSALTQFDICETSFHIALARDDNHEEHAVRCIDSAAATIGAMYPGLIGDLKARRRDSSLLEEFYILWQSGMLNLIPQPTESVLMYQDRQALARQELLDLGNYLLAAEAAVEAAQDGASATLSTPN